MDYIELFQNLRTNNKYGRKSPHKAILMLTVIELFEKNVLSDNEIYYDDTLKSMFIKVWNRVLPDEPLFHPEAYMPFWYLESDSFWHIVPNRGKEDILSLMRDTNIKPSEAKINDCVKYAELDDDLYFLMTLPSGRSSLKRALLETYTNLSEGQIDRMSESADNTIDYSASALSDYEKILSNEKDEKNVSISQIDKELERQFQNLNEDIQIVLNLQYYSFLKSHRNERDLFKEVCPSVYELLDKILNHPIKQNEIAPSFAFTYDNFLSDLKIALMSEEGSMELIDKIGEALDILRGNNQVENNNIHEEGMNRSVLSIMPEVQKVTSDNIKPELEITEVEHVFLDSHGNVVETIMSSDVAMPEREVVTDNRKGKPWTKDEEEQIKMLYHQGKDISIIAAAIGRTEVAVNLRLSKLGIIDYTYEQKKEPVVPISKIENTEEKDFTIENSFLRCSIFDRHGERVFSAEGKLKYIGTKLYRLNLKPECFTLKSMQYDGKVWIRGEKKIVAYPQSLLYRTISETTDYLKGIEDLVDSSKFESCRLKFYGGWYNFKGDLVSSLQKQDDDFLKTNVEAQGITRNPLYTVRKQAILRAMSFFRLPAKIKDIVRTISRTAWGATIEEKDVKEIINSITEVESADGKYILRKKK